MTPTGVAVLDVGKTSLSIVAVDRTGMPAGGRRRDSPSVHGPPYAHLDVEGAFDWICDALAELGQHTEIDAIVPVAHGAALALVGNGELILPILDYEHSIPALARTAEDYVETRSPALDDGLNLATQLAYVESQHAEDFARVEHALLLPQYLAWRLGGRPASEVTSLGCHTHLWNPGRGEFSRLARERGWDRLFPPLVPAWECIGTLTPALAERTGLSLDCKVHAGIHDSNASYLAHRATRTEPFAVVSTGTWVVTLAHGSDLAKLDEGQGMLANVDAFGSPIACMRFPGGREYAAEAQVSGPDAAALASAFKIDYCLDALGATGDVILEGPMARNPVIAGTLAALRDPTSVWVSPDPTGTTAGAVLLAHWNDPPPQARLQRAEPSRRPDLALRREQWLREPGRHLPRGDHSR